MHKAILERTIYGVIVTLGVFDAFLILKSDVRIDWFGYLPNFALVALLFGLGSYYRHCRRNEPIASALLGSGAFIAFTLVASIFNYLLLPVRFSLIDETLMALDASLGYRWVDIVTLASDYPAVTFLLKAVYFSSLPQLVVVVLILGFTARLAFLWEFLAVGLLSVLLCIGIWYFFPSFGPTTLVELPQETALKAQLGVGMNYGRELIRLGNEGADFLSPRQILGLIAFPSFHMVMAAMSVVYLWQVPWARWPALGLNFLMVPSILVHGGHYAVDLPAGLIVFLISMMIIRKLSNA